MEALEIFLGITPGKVRPLLCMDIKWNISAFGHNIYVRSVLPEEIVFHRFN